MNEYDPFRSQPRSRFDAYMRGGEFRHGRGPHPNEVTVEVEDWLTKCAVAFYLASPRDRLRLLTYLGHMPLTLQAHVHDMIGKLHEEGTWNQTEQTDQT